MSHTPGPWFATDNGRDPLFLTDANGDDVPMTRENEVLKAAAPELLEALETMVRYTDSLESIPCISAAMKAVGSAQAAIAKARGLLL